VASCKATLGGANHLCTKAQLTIVAIPVVILILGLMTHLAIKSLRINMMTQYQMMAKNLIEYLINKLIKLINLN
jgi:hypothetical protein